MKIAVAGAGYVGLSNAILLAQHNTVYLVDVDKTKVSLINQKKSPIDDKEIIEYLQKEKLDLVATTDSSTYKQVDYVIIATPTNYDSDKNHFDTSLVEMVIETVIFQNSDAVIIIKSTIPVGFTERMRTQFHSEKIFFSPEFLREGKALYDNLFPSRIILGGDTEATRAFAQLLAEGAKKDDIVTLFLGSTEAEAVKLFSNTYLALRVAFFNELDSYAETHQLDTAQIIEGMSQDTRIGSHYNNPSFGYGGYCLPKDTKQLRANYADVPNKLINAIVEANTTRKEFIAQNILNKQPRSVGVYRLTMKQNSDNFRDSSIIGVVEILQKNNIPLMVYEPSIKEKSFMGIPVISDLEEFKRSVDLVITNRYHDDLKDLPAEKIYTRDIFSVD